MNYPQMQGAAPAKDNSDWVSKVEDMYKQAEDWSRLRQMMVNVNYYSGNQWIGWNRETRRVIELPKEVGVERITLNKIRPRVLTLLSKHTKNRIKFDVIPASKEQKDMDAAKAANKYLQVQWQDLNMSIKTREIFLNNLVKGWCMTKTWFDPTAGNEITPQEGEVGYEEGMDPIHMGEIKVRVCDPFTIFIDPSATTEEEIRWILERKARDVDELEAEYGAKVTPDDNLDFVNSYDITSYHENGLQSNSGIKRENMAFVYELWHKPCKKYPNGLKVTVAGGKVLDEDDQAGDMPYDLFGYVPIPSTLHFDSLVKDMIPVQRGINVKRSMMATHAKRIGNAVWLVPLGSGVDEDELTDEHGGIVHYTPIANMRPERAMAPDIPSFYDRDLAQDAIDLDDMSGAREVSQGRMPSGIDTLGGLQIMVEQENEKLTVAAQCYEEGMKSVMRRILKLMQKHYTEERQGRIIGADSEVEVIAFNASDLTGFEDVVVIQGSSLPEMKAAQQERIMLMWDKGAIVKRDGRPDPQTLLRLMGMGDSTELFEQTELDENKAKLENKTFQELAMNPEAAMAYGQYFMQKQVTEQINQQMQQAVDMGTIQAGPNTFDEPPQPIQGMPLVRDFQDHEVHAYQHNLFRKSSEYDALPPEIQQWIDAHVKEHEGYLQQAAMQQAMMAMGPQQPEQQQSGQK